MSTTTINKTASTTLLALQAVSSGSVVVGSSINVSSKLSITGTIYFARGANTALTAAATGGIQYSPSGGTANDWTTLVPFSSRVASITSQAVNGTCNSGQAVVPMTSTTGMSVGDVVFIKNSTLGNSEFGRVITVTSNTSITLSDNLVNAQTGSTVYPNVDIFPFQLDLTSITAIRVIDDCSGTGQATHIMVTGITGDSLNTA